MVISKRERYIGIFTAVVLGLGLFYWIIFQPLTDRITDLDGQLKTAQDDLANADSLKAKKGTAERDWAAMSRNALSHDESTAESNVLNDVRDWAQESGMNLSSLKPERAPEKQADFYKVTFRATGSGQMSQVGRFLNRIQTATIPVRITDLSITSRKEGTDDLSVSVGISTIYLALDSDKSPRLSQNSTVSMAVQR